MAEPTLDELLKVGFKISAEMALDMLEPGLDWPDDIDGQRAIIRRLAGMATTTTILYEWQVWAFKKLNEIVAAEYGEKETARTTRGSRMVFWRRLGPRQAT